MRGDAEIVEALNRVLTAELTAINQYFVHYKMLENWGYKKLAEKKKAESIEEMNHADAVIERILFFDGVPNLQRLNPVRVGESPLEQHKLDLEMEVEAQHMYNEIVGLAREKGDNGTRALIEGMLREEEDSIDWHEAQLKMIDDMGIENYLAEQMS